MNEPDWTKAEDYEYTKEFKGDPTAWAWEFLRRNPNYRTDFAAVKSGEFTEKGYVPPKLPDETENQWKFRCVQNDIDPVVLSPERTLARKWGLWFFMCDPSLTSVELKGEGQAVEFDTDVQPALLEKWDDVTRLPTVEEEGGVVVVRRDRLVVSFDLTGPIIPQMNLVKEWFAQCKVPDSDGKKPNSYPFKNSLRVLDAMATLGDSFKNETARDILFAGDKGNLDKKTHDLIKTALTNMETGYRTIAKRRTPLTDN